jgi:hypothetical protein
VWRKPSKRLGKCARCGKRNVIVEEHHIYRRSLRHDLKKDPKNKADLCLDCHETVTLSRSAEEALQKQLYPATPPFRAKNDIDIKPMNTSKSLLLSKARSLRSKADTKNAKPRVSDSRPPS